MQTVVDQNDHRFEFARHPSDVGTADSANEQQDMIPLTAITKHGTEGRGHALAVQRSGTRLGRITAAISNVVTPA